MKINNLSVDKEGVYLNPNATIDYSDGNENEDYVYSTLKNSEDNSIFSPILLKKVKNWSSEYHFSPYRCNILRPINIDKSWSVLEIGGGCGSITRYLAETGAEIVSVEGSHNRSKCIVQRCKDLENVKVICSNVEDLEFDQKFDMITLIGVFEYTAKYSKKDNPYIEALRFYKSLLKPDGILVIAIENKLGIKYFSGYVEDHKGIPYYGLENLYESRDVRTFGKKELNEMIISADFFETAILYPFPDYKLPKVIFSESAFDNNLLNVVDLIRLTKNRNYSPKPKANLLRDELVWSSLHTNNLITHLSNSFLFVAKNAKVGNNIIDENQLAHFFACDRIEPWSTSTTFKKDSKKITVSKKALISNSHYKISSGISIKQHLSQNTPYITGNNFSFLMDNALVKKDYAEFKILFKQYINFLIQNAVVENRVENIGKTKIKPAYFDCLPANLIQEESKQLNLIDTEWEIQQEFDLNFLIVRALLEYKNIWGLSISFSKSFKTFVNNILLDNGLNPLSTSELKIILVLDTQIFEQIMLENRNAPSKLLKSFIYLIKDKLFEVKSYIIDKTFVSR